MSRYLTGLILAPFFIFNNVSAETVLSTREAMAFDIVTTKIGLNNGVIELNPLGLFGSTVVKGALLYYIESDDYEVNEKEIKFINNLYTAAGLSNLTVLLLNPPLAATLVLVSTYYLILDNTSN